ncbi:hypothetical protein CHUAL_009650 [Chamberlinius hualienensis]
MNRLLVLACICLVVTAFVSGGTSKSQQKSVKIPKASDSCADRCGNPYDSSQTCQCNTACGDHSDCCTDYSTQCGSASDSCAGRCGNPYDSSQTCQCNTACGSHGDCCSDYSTQCGSGTDSCAGRCGDPYDSSQQCQCNIACVDNDDCCSDYSTQCGSSGTITNQELLDISSQVWSADINRLTVGLDWQGQTSDGSTADLAPGPLCTGVPPEIDTNQLYVTLQGLFDDYERDENTPEDMTAGDETDIDNFLNQVTSTQAMEIVHTFLASKGLAPSDVAGFQVQLKDIWFTLYTRQGVLGSSGGEHVLLGEIQNGKSINGLHNWVRFCTQEEQGHINYLGYVDYYDLGGAYLIRNPFYWDDNYKPVGGFFIGTSPAFDLSIFTLCFYARPNALCTVNLNGYQTQIQTYTLDYDDSTYVGSAYPNF